jgi:hypothetical protein
MNKKEQESTEKNGIQRERTEKKRDLPTPQIPTQKSNPKHELQKSSHTTRSEIIQGVFHDIFCCE